MGSSATEKRIYRIETILNNDGPYICYSRWNVNDHDDENHPLPEYEFGSFWFDEGERRAKELGHRNVCYKKLIFGFTSKKQLRKWFCRQERKNLQRLGFVVSEYIGDVIFKSSSQCIFIKKEFVKLHDITEI